MEARGMRNKEKVKKLKEEEGEFKW